MKTKMCACIDKGLNKIITIVTYFITCAPPAGVFYSNCSHRPCRAQNAREECAKSGSHNFNENQTINRSHFTKSGRVHCKTAVLGLSLNSL